MYRRIANWEAVVLVNILGALVVVCLSVVKMESITCDEIAHITAGMSYIQLADGRMNSEHPPLVKVLAAIPLVSSGATARYDDPSWGSLQEWGLGAASFRNWGSAGPRMLYLARMPMILLTTLLGLAVFFMARALAGAWGAVLSLLVYASSPFFLAYGPLVLTDVGVALFALLTVWTFASLWETPTLLRSITFALCLTAALLSKFSSGLLLPVVAGLAIWFAVKLAADSSKRSQAIRYSFLGSLLACILVYLTYAVLFRKTDTAWLLSYRYMNSKHPIHAMQVTADLLRTHPWCSRILQPIVLYLLGVGETLHHLPRPTYLLGRIYLHGTHAYFPVLFFYKMTPAFLLLLLLLPCSIVLWKLTGERGTVLLKEKRLVLHAQALSALMIVFVAASLLSPLNVGVRHLTIPIAILTIFMGLIVPLSNLAARGARVIVLVIVVLSLAGGLYSAIYWFPNYVAYFNDLKGTTPSYKIAVDSNLDWGQSLVVLHDAVKSRGIDSIALDTPGSIPEMSFSNPSEFLCEQGLPADIAWVAVGTSRFVEHHDFSIDPEEQPGKCNYLLKYPYWSIAGGSVYLFHIRTATQDVSVTDKQNN